jgi:hypothetical protein
MKIFLNILTVLTLWSCCGNQSDLETVLEFAGDNRVELEKVLAHFEGDSLKYEAARFLIVNMPGHMSYQDSVGAKRFFMIADSVLSAVKGCGYDCGRNAIDSLMNSETVSFAKAGYVKDIEIITADYLIANIDEAFSIWENAPWAAHLDFEEFCETLLPYKTMEPQLLSDWRKPLRGRFSEGIKEMDYCDIYTASPIRACMTVNKNLRDSVSPDIRGNDYSVAITNPVVKLKIPFGNCGDYADIAMAVMRSEGIPVMKDYTPIWSYRPLGHEWNVVMNKEGRWIPFGGALTEPGIEEKLDERMSKVYRCTYAYNPEIVKLIGEERYVPRTFKSPFIKDVTSEYVACTDVAVDFPSEQDGYVYIALSNGTGWEPIDFCRLKNGKGIFKNIGVNSLYTIVRYEDDGACRVMEPPFHLTRRGEKHYFIPNEDKRETVSLRRKFLALPHVTGAAMRSYGGEFHASNSADFNDYDLVYKIDDAYAYAHEVMVKESVEPKRYWRYKQDKHGTHCNMAEIRFFDDDNNEVKGRVIGTDGSFLNPPTATKYEVFDNDLLTVFEAPIDSGAWVGMDFGKPVKMSRILFTTRGDGNSIELMDSYELFYFKDGGWQSLGKRFGDGYAVKYDNVPENALLILRDHTKGKEERIFTYENGRQVWW